MPDPIKFTELNENTAPLSGDLIITVHDPEGSPEAQKATLASIAANMPSIDMNIGEDFELYNTADKTINYERFFMRWGDDDTLIIGTEAGGEGVVRDIRITNGNSSLRIGGDIKLEAMNYLILTGGQVKFGTDAIFPLVEGENYERAYMGWLGDVFKLGTEAGGDGEVRDVQISGGIGDKYIKFGEEELDLFCDGAIKLTGEVFINGNIQFIDPGSFFYLYNVYDPESYELAYFDWDSDVFRIGTEKGGAGLLRNIQIVRGSSLIEINEEGIGLIGDVQAGPMQIVSDAVDVQGILTGLAGVMSYGADQLLTEKECRGYLIRITATATATLPPVVVGGTVTIYSTTTAAVMVDPDGDDRIVLDGVAGGDGKKVTSASGAGDFVTLIGDSADGWTVVGRSGTWTMES